MAVIIKIEEYARHWLSDLIDIHKGKFKESLVLLKILLREEAES